MPFYIYCIRCNSDGSYGAVDKDCGKCSGTGNDWREDHETSYLDRYDVSLEDLKKKSKVKSKDGTYIFYLDDFPSLEEERSRVTYRKKEFKSWEKPDVEIDNFKARLKFFTDNFYHDTVLNLDSSDNLFSMTGGFDRINLGITISGLSEKILEKSKSVLKEVAKEQDHLKTVDLNYMLNEYPDYIYLLASQEAISHESFHFIQFMTCKSLNTLYRASRKLMAIRVALFSECIRHGVKFKYGSENIFDGILKIDNEEDKKYFFDVIENSRLETLIIKNFFKYKGKKSGLTILDLTEGSAFTFQKIVNRSQEIVTFEPVGCYIKAWQYYQENEGNESVIFLLTSYFSLKYGILDDGDYMGVMPSPPEIFEMLCSNISKYEGKLFLIDSNNLIEQLKEIIDIMKSNIYDFIISSGNPNYTLDEFNDKEYTKSDTLMLHDGYEAIADKISEAYPNIHTDDFIITLISDYVYSSKFCNFITQEIPKVKFKGVFGQESDIKEETFIFKLVDDFDDFIRGNWISCCKKHAKQYKYGVITQCNEKGSFNRNILVTTQLHLNNIVVY